MAQRVEAFQDDVESALLRVKLFGERSTFLGVMPGLDPGIHLLKKRMDCRGIGVR